DYFTTGRRDRPLSLIIRPEQRVQTEPLPKKLLVDLRRRQKLLGNLGDEIESHTDRKVSVQSEVGVDHLAGVQIHQFPCLQLEINPLSVREPFQSRAKPALRTPCTLGDPSQLAAVPG